ncbi:MAG: LysR family transcriptional regulator, partial [Alphaproteobacteria bacterium]
MVDFRTLETFVWVANLGSFRRAALRLHTTQPAVSQRIAQLEAEVGRRLIDRERRQFGLTDAGRRLLDHAERLLRGRTELLRDVADPASLTGTLRLGVAETIVHTWLSAFLQRMAKTFPQLVLEIDVDVSATLRGRLIERDLDLAFLLGPISVPMVENMELSRYDIGFIASPAVALTLQPPTLANLAAQPILTFSRSTRPFSAVRDLFTRAGHSDVRIHASTSLATIVRMAVNGLGVAAIPPAIVAEDLAAHRLVMIDTG